MINSKEDEQTSQNRVADDPSILFNLESLTCRYRQQVALDNISVDFPSGQLIAVCGYSGSGKSTLLNTLGLLRYGRKTFAGTIKLQLPGLIRNYQDLNSNHRQLLRREQFGFVLQSSYLLPNITCLHNIEMPLLIQKGAKDDIKRQVKSLLKELCQNADKGTDADQGCSHVNSENQNETDSKCENDGQSNGTEQSSDRAQIEGDDQSDLITVLNRLPKEASGGQRQRIAILRALVHDPSIVFADEPCANLDPLNAESVMQLLRKWLDAGITEAGNQRLRTILLVSHDTESVIKFADKILVLRQGKIVEGRLLDRSDFPENPEFARSQLNALMKNGHI